METPNPEMRTINLTPKGFTGPDAKKNAERANKAIEALATANADYANKMEEIFSVIGRDQFPDLLRSLMGREDAKEYMDEIDSINERRSKAREEMLRSLAGAPAV